MTASGSEADVAALATMGTYIQAVASVFDTVHSVIPAGDRMSAWPSGVTLSDAERVWSGFLEQLADQVRRLGAAMSATAAAYRAADLRSADRLTAAGVTR
ncbi:hypothetical protein [Winogradskya consettensis]|nr:hypothetical protein [Actinoplanes consettensis]